MDSQDLEKLGLNRNEARVYLSLLTLGRASAADVVKHVGTHRNIVYDNLEKLIEKGLVSFLSEGTKRIFIAEDPQAILDFLQAKKESIGREELVAKSLLPDINKLLSVTRSKQDAYLFRGVKGMKKVLGMALESKEYFCIGVTNASVELLGDSFWKNFNAKVDERKITERLLLNADFENPGIIKQTKLRKQRVLPAQMSQVTEMMVFGEKVAIFVYSGVPIVVLIEDKHIAADFRKQFDVLWKVSG
jgi:sugar-specific transcriptional regulator TrmB